MQPQTKAPDPFLPLSSLSSRMLTTSGDDELYWVVPGLLGKGS